MGLFSKSKTDTRRRSLPHFANHALHHRSESSVTEISEFLLTASASSYSSQDSHRKDLHKPTGAYAISDNKCIMSPEPTFSPNSYSYISAKYPTNGQIQGLPRRLDVTREAVPNEANSAHLDTSHDLSISYSDDSNDSHSESNDSRDCSQGSTSTDFDPARRHPYYEQWKQYYAALAASKKALYTNTPPQPHAQPVQTMPQAQPVSMVPHTQRVSTSRSPPEYTSFQSNFNALNGSSLLKKSRQSTIRSTRSFSMSHVEPQKSAPTARAISVNVTAADMVEEPEADDFSGAQPSILGSLRRPRVILAAGPGSRVTLGSKSKLLAHGLLALALDDLAISDYEAFLFNDSGDMNDSNNSMEKTEQDQSCSNDASLRPHIMLTEHSHALSPQHFSGGDTILTQDLMTEAAFSEPTDSSAHLTPPWTPGVQELSRASSRDSAKSFNSLQSEKKFKVGGSRRIFRSETKGSKSGRFVPPMAGPPPPNFDTERVYSQDGNSGRHSIASFPMQNTAYLQQIQQQLQQLQQLQQMQQMQMPGYANTGPCLNSSPSPPPPKSSDPTINAAIEEFVLLRNIIASGQKSFEYRLLWVKMLLEACNYKLYSYISIRGLAILSEQSHSNKQFFIKSFLNHLNKLLKELDGLNDRTNMKILAEACYIRGCLLKQEYVYKYDQTFGIDRDDQEAERYLLRCIDLHPGLFKAHFQLGDLYEQQESQESYELAMTHYKESARMGFNRAIYQVAMLYLTDSRSRLIKFLKYLRNLAETDMNSKDIVLNGFDRNELEEVVGLALFQLGKIYEGIYPGDLAAEDDFVKDCLTIAPVNYCKSLSYYNRAAKLHCLQAQVKLGLVYENGELNRHYNPNKSIQWFTKASISPLKFKRHPEALLGISRWFMRGSNNQSKQIQEPDPQRAVMWCERAIKEFNYPEAYYIMGTYAKMGVVQGPPEEWFNNAFSLGFQPGEENLHESM